MLKVNQKLIQYLLNDVRGNYDLLTDFEIGMAT
jgi:hypothetical protein